jgi:Fur family ferric uptake transcriptional regulator/Fur family peroxide stress response transcriptional regulator
MSLIRERGVSVATTLRLTPQRRAVLEVLRDSHDHPTATDVYDRVRTRLPGVGAATVYRTLSLLVETGAALELSLGAEPSAARFDANTTRHDHLVCESCGVAVDVDLPLSRRRLADLADHTGFAISTYDLQFRGRCPACQHRKD